MKSQSDGSAMSQSLDQPTLLEAVTQLKFFLATAPTSFDTDADANESWEKRCLRRLTLPTGEQISCVLWNGLYHITGTDIVRALSFRFSAFGRPVRNTKKFEEGVFSDLRNLKSGTDATLEDPKSDFLEQLFKHNCIRTQKKQKVFYWFSVPHDRLFLDALDRDLKREKLGMEATTEALMEPALSFSYNPSKSLFEQFAKSQDLRSLNTSVSCHISFEPNRTDVSKTVPGAQGSKRSHEEAFANREASPADPKNVLGSVCLFEGSPTYKQRRKQGTPPLKRQTPRIVGEDEAYTTNVPMNSPPPPELPVVLRSSSSPASYAFSLAPGYSHQYTPTLGGLHQDEFSFSQEKERPAWDSMQPPRTVYHAGHVPEQAALRHRAPYDGAISSTNESFSAPVHDGSIAESNSWLSTVSTLDSATNSFEYSRSASVDHALLPYDHYPVARRHRSTTPVIRRTRVSTSHPTFAPYDSHPANFIRMANTTLPFSDQLQAVDELTKANYNLYAQFGRFAEMDMPTLPAFPSMPAGSSAFLHHRPMPDSSMTAMPRDSDTHATI